jgi:hypothetical protein
VRDERHAAARLHALRGDAPHDINREFIKVEAADEDRAAFGESHPRRGIQRNQFARRHEVRVRLEVQRVDAQQLAVGVVERDAREVVRHDAAQAGGDSLQQFAQVKVRGHRVADLEQQAQAVALARRLTLGWSCGM